MSTSVELIVGMGVPPIGGIMKSSISATVAGLFVAASTILVASRAAGDSSGIPLRENYHPLTGEGRNVKHFSWSAAHLLMMILESR